MKIHGHRGCRGLIPENTISGFVKAIELGVDGVELDVVVSRDNQVLASHEPWMDAEKCLQPNGADILKENEKEFNIYELRYEDIALFDCGSKQLKDFPHQINQQHQKPLLYDAVKMMKSYASEDLVYNIEIKSERDWYGEFQPEPSILIQLVYRELRRLKVLENTMIQSFDPTVLNLWYKKYEREVPLALLIENNYDFERNLSRLIFEPNFYNPFHELIDQKLVDKIHSCGMQIYAWTVNEPDEALRLKELGVDGIITDYPDVINQNLLN